ncbi:MAG: hypothetical protein FWD61_04545 [Phycisphaerales bacterium]|nr:hypothetical protein [Phycisphaerales bacterium]
MEMRFVVLLHERHGEGGGAHYDFFLEVPGREKLMAWRVSRGPEEWGKVDDKELGVERIADHRKVYLEYEGEISGGRGTVKRVAEGVARVVKMTEKEIRVRVEGKGVGMGRVGCEMVLPMDA